MQNPKRRSDADRKKYTLKEYTPNNVLNAPVQALLCAGLLLPGLLSLPAFASAEEPVQETAQEAVQDKGAGHAAPETKPLPDTVQSAQSDGSDGPAESDGSGLHLPSITDFAPGSVYSGTLGELVRLQAGQEMARAALSLKEIQARILEVENSMVKARRELSEAKAQEEADREAGMAGKASVQEAVNELKSGFASLAEDVAALRLEKAQGSDRQCLVLSVRSQGSRLVAEIATKDGRFLAGAGDKVPGVGRIDSVSRSKVTAEGRSLPWK